MSADWRMIYAGFAIAANGSIATALYIVGLSGLYIGRYRLGVLSLLGACILALLFFRLLGRYLSRLDVRAGEEAPPQSPDA